MSRREEATDGFGVSRQCFEEMAGWLDGPEAAELTHGELEDQLDRRGRELLRRMFQEHLELRAVREQRAQGVVDVDGVTHGAVEPAHHRRLATIFGELDVERLAYRHRGHPNLYPADRELNLPQERHSHGLRRLAAIESARGSFEAAGDAIERATGQHVGKRQVEQLAARAAVDVDAFYAASTPQPAAPDDVLVISADGKGIIMRPDDLRPVTAKAAAAAAPKLEKRRSKGERRYRKRFAEVGAVYDITPVPRGPADVLASHHGGPAPPAPTARSKWVTASVVDDAAVVVGQVFDEAERRDPGHERTWVALVDGNNHQIHRLQTEARQREINVTIVVDFIHVLEYLWAAVWCFFREGSAEAETWVRDRALAVLEGRARQVAAGIRRRATASKLPMSKRRRADACAAYLTNKAPYLNYPHALSAGWPIATGVIEGTCRYLVADRMDITGARWSVQGAEAILKLRATRTNGDFDNYWRFHLHQERHRVHDTRYANDAIPAAA
jgi:hypothetical protein